MPRSSRSKNAVSAPSSSIPAGGSAVRYRRKVSDQSQGNHPAKTVVKAEAVKPSVCEDEKKEGPRNGGSSKTGRNQGKVARPNPPAVVKAVKDKDKYPAIRKHGNPNYADVTYYLPVSNSYTEPVVKEISKYHPVTLKDVHTTKSDNEHPYCAALRSISEAYALASLIAELKQYKGERRVIMDIGGAVKRHHSNKRDYVWSCIPPYDSRDQIRQFSLPGDKHCFCKWQECTHVQAAASISVHSLYYLTPLEIHAGLLKQGWPVHYAVVHLYPANKGKIMMGEMEYEKRGGKVKVQARGNLTPYVHDSCDWMASGHWDGPSGTLEWDVARRFGDLVVLRFVAGKTRTYLRHDWPSEEKKAEEVKTVEVDDPDTVEKANFDKLVDSVMHYYEPISQKGYNNFMTRVRRKGDAAGYNQLRLTQHASAFYVRQGCVVPAVPVSLWYTAILRQWRLGLNIGIPPMLRQLLARGFIPWITIIALLGLAICTPMPSGPSRFNALGNGEYMNPGVGMSYGILGALAAFTAVAFYFLFDSGGVFGRTMRFGDLKLSLFRVVGAYVNDYCCTLPDREMDPTKCRKFVYPRDYEGPCEEKPAARAMIYHPSYPPFFPRKCPHNLVHCIKNKLLYKVPGAGKYSFSLHPRLRNLAKLIRVGLMPLDFDAWVSRFDGPKEQRLRREAEERKDQILSWDWNRSSLFPKFEAYPEPKYPRPIVSAEVELNYSIGRWLIPIADLFAELLEEDSSPQHVYFPLHGDAAKIGRFHDAHKAHCMYDSDFSAFDSSQREECLRMISEFLSECGVPSKVIARELQDVEDILIKTRSGLRASVKSIRCSGRSATLLGNSLVTLNTTLHLYGDNLAGLLVKGDDCVLYLHRPIDTAAFVKAYLANGLVVKLREVNEFDVEFCSSIFLPCAEGSVLVPKPGKLLAKTFWDKDLGHSPMQSAEHCASILKGLEKSLRPVPGFNGVYDNKLYTHLSPRVNGYREQYNEYTDDAYTATDETLSFMGLRYGLNPAELEALSSELKHGFPIRLQSQAAAVMIEKDWGPQNDADHLVENTDVITSIGGPCFEEFVRWLFPWVTTIFIGVFESLCSNSPLNLLGHLLLYFFSRVSPLLALLVHLAINSAGLKLNIWTVMTKRGKNKPKAVKARTQQPSIRVPGGRKKKSKGLGGALTGALAEMVANPCDAKLAPGLYGTEAGILTKFKTNYGNSSIVTTNGYVVWVPSYVGLTGTGDTRGVPLNFFWWDDVSAEAQPANNSAHPLGSGGVLTSWSASVGASPFVVSATCQDFRTVAACMRALYTGTTSSCQGRIAILDNIPADLLTSSPPTVAEMFAYSSSIERVSLEPMEVTFRPSSESANFRGSDAAVFTAHAGSPAILTPTAAANVPQMMGFAWQGVPGGQFQFDLIQAIEWRPKISLGYVDPPLRQVHNENMFSQVTRWLDSNHPGWSNTLFRHGLRVGSRVAAGLVNTVLGGPPQRLAIGYH